MIGKRQLGIFFGSNSLSIAEIEKQKLASFFDAPHSLFDETKSSSAQSIPDNIRLTAIIQKSLRDKKIDINVVRLSLASKDVILRSFFIPWMTSAEVKGVVDFEARRYLPFKLEELVYGYRAKTVADKQSRRIRILFVAARRDILDKYISILGQASLKIGTIEPSVLSLLRVLTYKKLLNTRQRIAIIQMDKNEGTILVVDQGIPQFIRDFRIVASRNEAFDLDPNAVNLRLLNEVRISLDYYRRQHTAESVHKVLLISSHAVNDLAENLGKDLGIPAESLSIRTLLGLEEEVSLGVLNAFGIGLKGLVSFPVDIDFAKSLAQPEETAKEPEKIFEQVPLNYISIIKVAAGCALFLLFFFIFSEQRVAAYQRKVNTLTKNQGLYESLTIADLDKKREDALQKLKAYQNVRLKSDAASLLNAIPALLPKGVWLSTLSINYADIVPTEGMRSRATGPSGSKFKETSMTVSIDMAGYAFHREVNKQIDIVNQLIANLKQSPELTPLLDTVNLTNATKQKLDYYTATNFQIQCR